MKNYFIILRGPAGVGKTTIGKRLARRLRGYHVPFSQILKKHNLHYKGGKWIPEKNLLKANKIIIPIILKKLKEGKNVILESNFYHKSQIEDLIKNIPYQYPIFTLKANIKELISRDKGRKEKTKIGEKGIKVVYKLVKKFDYGIIIDTNNKNIEQTIKEIKSFLI